MTMMAPTTFGSMFAGELIGPDHPNYDSARKVFSGAFDKRPTLIARCTTAADVQLALACARERDWSWRCTAAGIRFPGTPPATAAWSSIQAR